MSTSDTVPARIQKEITELTESVAGMVSSFKKFQRPLVESRKKVPQATSQLDKISEATEAVATRMLDMVEQITQREEEVISGIEAIREKAAAGSTEEIEGLAQDLAGLAGENLNDAFLIMESLQFQDITAQQMDHAAALLEEVERKLHTILKTLGAPEAATLEKAKREPSKPRAFDPHAEFLDKKTDQKDIDSLFARQEE